jgi:hypothetical protein
MNRIACIAMLLLGALALAAPTAEAQRRSTDTPTIQIAPFVGYQFGGSIFSETFDRKFSFKSGLNWGGSVDFAIGESWRFEAYYSRQDTELQSAGLAAAAFDVKVERLMVGFQEEKGEGSVKFFGTILFGATRYTPANGSLSGDTRFSAALGLGVKSFFTPNFGLRLESHAFYTSVESGGGVFCTAGTCIFRYSGSGIWQGDVTAGLIIAF